MPGAGRVAVFIRLRVANRCGKPVKAGWRMSEDVHVKTRSKAWSGVTSIATKAAAWMSSRRSADRGGALPWLSDGGSGKVVAIALHPARIDLAVIEGGATIQRRRVDVSLGDEVVSWSTDLRRVGLELQDVVREFDLQDKAAIVVYHSPSQVVDVAHLEVRSVDQACEAAILNCTDSAPYSLAVAVSEAMVIGHDACEDESRTHAVVAIDRDDAVSAIAEMVETAGLQFRSATPIDAVITAQIVRAALDHDGPDRGWLHIGEHGSFFCVAGRGTIRLARPIALGVDTLARSITHPMRLSDDAEPIELESHIAREILHRYGIPREDQIVHEELQIERRHIMPLIQPVLQRYVVEIRQSVRFGLEEDQRESLKVTLSGPGAAIPRFAAVLSSELGIAFDVAPHGEVYDHEDPMSPGGDMHTALTDRRTLAQLNLQPDELAHQRRSAELRRWLWVGAAVTLAMICIDGFRLQMKLSDLRDREQSLAGEVHELEAWSTTQEKLANAIGAMNGLEQTINQEVGAQVNVGALLQELTLLTPDSVQITSLSLHRREKATHGSIAGFAAERSDANEPEPLQVFIEALKASPLCDDLSLHNVQMGSLREVTGVRFEASLLVVPAPALTDRGIVVAERVGEP